MVTIRLTRRGGKNQPFYHVVVTDKRRRQGGSSVEQVGFFNPRAVGGEAKLRLDLARIEYWQGQGAEVSDRVRSLVKAYRSGAEGGAAQGGSPGGAQQADAGAAAADEERDEKRGGDETRASA
jgi:small subunit ribosomal protein S16